MPIDFSKIPNYVHVNDSLKILQYKNYHGQNYAIPLLGGSYGLTYNADKVEKPDSFDVLFDPDNKCKTSLTKSQFAANLYLATLKSGYSQDQLYNMESEIFSRGLKNKTVLENLKQLYANVCAQDRFWEGSVNLSLKDLHYGTTYWFGVASAQKQGANWKIAHDVRSTVWLDTISFVPTLKDSPKKLKAAYLLANFMLSDEIQTEIHQTYGVVVVNKRVAQEVTDLSIFFQEEWLWKPLTLRTQAIYKIMHDNVINQLPEHYSPKEN